MSAPDARLSAAERAALADLEAAAAADDPHLAARLRGSPSARARAVIPRLGPRLRRRWALVVSSGPIWGTLLLLGGLAAVVVGMGEGLAVSVAGAVAAALGLRVLAEAADRRTRLRSPH